MMAERVASAEQQSLNRLSLTGAATLWFASLRLVHGRRLKRITCKATRTEEGTNHPTGAARGQSTGHNLCPVAVEQESRRMLIHKQPLQGAVLPPSNKPISNSSSSNRLQPDPPSSAPKCNTGWPLVGGFLRPSQVPARIRHSRGS